MRELYSFSIGEDLRIEKATLLRPVGGPEDVTKITKDSYALLPYVSMEEGHVLLLCLAPTYSGASHEAYIAYPVNTSLSELLTTLSRVGLGNPFLLLGGLAQTLLAGSARPHFIAAFPSRDLERTPQSVQIATRNQVSSGYITYGLGMSNCAQFGVAVRSVAQSVARLRQHYTGRGLIPSLNLPFERVKIYHRDATLSAEGREGLLLAGNEDLQRFTTRLEGRLRPTQTSTSFLTPAEGNARAVYSSASRDLMHEWPYVLQHRALVRAAVLSLRENKYPKNTNGVLQKNLVRYASRLTLQNYMDWVRPVLAVLAAQWGIWGGTAPLRGWYNLVEIVGHSALTQDLLLNMFRGASAITSAEESIAHHFDIPEYIWPHALEGLRSLTRKRTFEALQTLHGVLLLLPALQGPERDPILAEVDAGYSRLYQTFLQDGLSSDTDMMLLAKIAHLLKK